jgi:hypothetical protein
LVQSFMNGFATKLASAISSQCEEVFRNLI